MRDHQWFDTFARKNKMRPQKAVETKHGKVLLADSEEPILEDGRLFYRTGYAVQRHGLDIGNHHDYAINETGGSRTDQQYRLDEALIHAQETLAQLEAAGYYDA